MSRIRNGLLPAGQGKRQTIKFLRRDTPVAVVASLTPARSSGGHSSPPGGWRFTQRGSRTLEGKSPFCDGQILPSFPPFRPMTFLAGIMRDCHAGPDRWMARTKKLSPRTVHNKFACVLTSLSAHGLRPSPGQTNLNRQSPQSAMRRSRREFEITETELKLMAAAARIGLSSRPKNGYSTPAAMGTPNAL